VYGFLKYFPLAALLVLSAACSHKVRIIPKDEMTDIFADMLMADAWITAHPSAKKQADTTLVYDPIFEKYGYDRDDYQKSVAYYLLDPDDMEKMFKVIQDRFDARIKVLERQVEFEDSVNEIKGQLPAYVPEHFCLDSLGRDSLSWWRRFAADTVAYVINDGITG